MLAHCHEPGDLQALHQSLMSVLPCSLGAALAHLYTAALLVPPESPWNTEGMEMGRFKALVTQGQPRLGTYMYNRRLENVLCKAADPTQNK